MALLLTRLGIELGSKVLRAVRVEGVGKERARGVEVDWDPTAPDEAIGVLLEHCGGVRRVALAVDLPWLFTKRVHLPAVSVDARREIVRLEPHRFFPVRSDDVVPAVRANDDLVFAARGSQLAGWIGALERIAPVELVEPGPAALTRALSRVGVRDATVLLDGGEDGIGLLDLTGGRLTGARRLFRDPGALTAAFAGRGTSSVFLNPWSDDRATSVAELVPGLSLRPLPATTVPAAFLAAYGAALGIVQPPALTETLVAPDHERRIRMRRVRERGLAGAMCAIAGLFLFTSLAAWRARSTRALDAGLEALRAQAAPVLALQTELETLGQRAQAIRTIDASRPDPLRVLLALSQHLPAGAFLRGVHTSDNDWQIDGYAPNAARVIGALGAVSGITNLHFLAATNRAQVGAEQLESFALAFRFVPAP